MGEIRRKSVFEGTEVFIAKGEKLDYSRRLLYNNTGQKLPEKIPPKAHCELRPVSYMKEVLAPKFFQAHWAEVGQDKSWEVDCFWEFYQTLEYNDQFQITVLFVNNEPVGYFLGIIGHPTHYQSKTVLTSDAFYIAPEFRAQYSVRLFKAAEAFAKAVGVSKMYLHFKVYKDISPLTKRLGFQPMETVVAKSLE